MLSCRHMASPQPSPRRGSANVRAVARVLLLKNMGKNLKYVLCLLMPLLFSFSVANAKENKDLMKADYYYNHYIYYKAIPCYEKVAAQLNDPVIYARLAECYSVLNDMEKAADAYAKAVAIKECSPGIVLKY